MLKVDGDSFLVIFRNVHKAIRCSVSMQRALVAHNAGRPEEEQVLLCVGLGFGRVLRIGDTDVYGAEVNAASKLGEDTARAWEILATKAVRDAAKSIDGIAFDEIDECPPGANAAFRLTY